MDGGAQLQKPSLKRPGTSACPRISLGRSVSCHASGLSQRKKVKFADMAKVHQENSRKQSLPLSEERAHVPNTKRPVDEVKTLEYKSFKRLTRRNWS
ncbi:hypothetical protein J5N97_001531 [Dioscorea zingiberensis]|uniref:Uncharacterized protein n=1 Tax=Dioscorea zingiberensis TaxID=325984 RepID=A0A9D5H384_9LILI|nr:hypothetical protein J5N97_001531 [Dioscorea zingiberensis]